ncbi:flippase [Methanoplanus sp. FWC-SCC4]|uniref:Flippase n=1 Tax=Methanochimaera problematica TaxID=2609417 RepID=A0AA97I4D3_9EURY|nr:flippase [Methanoplanus sp. FWC-SCC4]WOF16394.1 flippase [Methanoplanus sp. FWC-SCC4]
MTPKISDKLMKVDETERQAIISFFSTIILTFFGFFSTVYFAHKLGAEVLGEYGIFIAYFGTFTLFSNAGFGSAAIKKISEGKERDEYFTASAVIRLLLLFATVIAAVIAAPIFVDFSGTGLYPFMIAALIISYFGITVQSSVYGTGKVGLSEIARLSNEIVRIALQIIFVYAGFKSGGLAGGFIAGMLVAAFINLKNNDLKLKSFKIVHLREMYKYSFWIFMASGGAVITSYAGTVLIGYFNANYDVGIYTTVYQFTTIVAFASAALQTALYPKISRWHAEGKTGYIENALSRAITYSLLLALPACAGGIMLGERLLYFLYGADFAKGALALSLLLVAQIFCIFVNLGASSLNAISHPEKSFKAGIVVSAICLLLNLILIPVAGINGAAAATLISFLVGSLIFGYIIKQYVKLKFQKIILRNIVFSTAAMAAVISASMILIKPSDWLSTLLLVSIGAFVYVLVLLKTDKTISDDLKDLLHDLNIPVPGLN